MSEDLYEDLFWEDKKKRTDFKEILFRYLIHWPWIATSLAVCLAAAWLYLRYTPPVYNITASVLIKDDDKSSKSNSLNDLEELGFITSTSNFDNEMEILHSRTLIKKVVEDLDHYISYYAKGRFNEVEIYRSTPVRVWITPQEAGKFMSPATVLMNLHPGNKLDATIEIGEEVYSKSFDHLPALITTPHGTFSFSATDSIPVQTASEVKAVIKAPRIVGGSYGGNLTIEPTSKTTTIAQLALKTTHVRRGEDFINKLIELYNREANEDKNEVATKTAEFIDERIQIINSELGTTEQELEDFKRQSGLTDLHSDAQLALTENSEYEKRRADNATQLRLVQYLETHANNPDNAFEVLPADVGLSDRGLSEVINRYNEMLIERKRLLRASSESNPAVVNLDASIRLMHNNVLTTIASVRRGLLITQADLERQASKYYGKIANAPGQERQFVSMSRQQEIKANLYLMLLQKREENAITLASTANNARAVDEALADLVPISPKRQMIYLVALIIGLVVPICIIYLYDVFKYNIEGRADVEKITSLPIIGDIPLHDATDKASIVVQENKNNLMDEVFRNIRTNVLYMMQKGQQVILITSTTTGEGKTFISSNLALSLTMLNKKVVLVGLDIRKPGLNKIFNISRKENGVSQYLADPDGVDLLSLIQPSGVSDRLFILPGGPVPPNPTELVARESLDRMINNLKEQFDYVVLDTAPIGMVSDTQLIARTADVSIYVCRADYTHKADYTLINDLHEQKKLPNICTIVNGMDMTKRKYGYYYGYGKYGKYGKYYGYGRKYSYGYGYGKEG